MRDEKCSIRSVYLEVKEVTIYDGQGTPVHLSELSDHDILQLADAFAAGLQYRRDNTPPPRLH